ncbi:hypothetical protein D3C72_1581430 [compost metagenome]
MLASPSTSSYLTCCPSAVNAGCSATSANDTSLTRSEPALTLKWPVPVRALLPSRLPSSRLTPLPATKPGALPSLMTSGKVVDALSPSLSVRVTLSGRSRDSLP